MLDKPTLTGLLTQWHPQPVAIALVTLLLLGYAWLLRRSTLRIPRRRVVVFAAGIALFGWASCGFPGVYADSLYWVRTAQLLGLWLIVPIIVLSGRPIHLARQVPATAAWVDRLLSSRLCRVVGNPLVGPALVPLLSAVLFFGPLPEWSVRWSMVGWLVQVVLVLLGAVMVLPLVGLAEDTGSLAVGLSMLVGSFELVLVVLPGVLLRLRSGLVSGWFDNREMWSWSPEAIADQQLAGNILWSVAEVIALPFLVLVFRRWLRVDARDAAEIDAVLEAERSARHGLRADRSGPERDAPWWLSDPRLAHRYGAPARPAARGSHKQE